MYIKGRQSSSGHCLSFGPVELIFILVAGLFSLVAGLFSLLLPVATLWKVISTLLKRGVSLLDGPDLPVDERLPAIRGPLLSAAELDIVTVTSNEDLAHCPVCATALKTEDIVTCPKCQTKHHQDCWEFNNKSCAVYGCAIAVQTPASIDTSKPAAMTPIVQEKFNEVRRRFRRWFWAYRLQWWSTVSFCFFAASGFFITSCGHYSRALISMFTNASTYAFVVALLCFLLARVFRAILEGTCERLPLVPEARMAALLQKIEKSQSRPQLERAVEWSPYIFAMMSVLPLSCLLLPAQFGVVDGTLYAAINLLFGGFFVWMALISTRRHRATLERIRCRLRGASKI